MAVSVASRTMSGGRAVVESFRAHGVRAVFGIPGVHVLDVYDALLDAPEIRSIVARNELGAAFMADGYARATGRPGIVITTTGPGACNSMAAMGEAYSDSIPVLNFSTQIPLGRIGKDTGEIHDNKDQLGMFRTVTKWNARADRVEDVAPTVAEAFYQMLAGRPRPVEVEVPTDLLGLAAVVAVEEPRPLPTHPPDEAQVRRAVDLLTSGGRPLIWAGGGAVWAGAAPALRHLAEALQAPVLASTKGKGAFPDDHPLALGNTCTNALVQRYIAESGSMLAVGTRFGFRTCAEWRMRPPARLVHVDVDPTQFGKIYPVAEGIQADARLAVEALLAEVRRRGYRAEPRAEEVGALRREVWSAVEARSPVELRLLRDLRAALPRHAIVSNDATIPSYWARFLFDVYEPRTWLFPSGWTTLGYGFPAALGAKVGAPDTPVVCIAGDGGFQFTMQELATAVQHDIRVILLVFNDNCYGVLKDFQQARFGGRTTGVDLVNPNFVRLAEAYGIRATRLGGPQDVGDALRDAVRAGDLTLIEVPAQLSRPSW